MIAAVLVHMNDEWTVHRALNTMDSTKIKGLQDSTSHVPSDTDRKSALTEDKAPVYSSILQKIVWRNVIFFIYTHFAALYGAYLIIYKAKGLTTLFGEYLQYTVTVMFRHVSVFVWIFVCVLLYEGWNFNSGNYLFTTDTK